MNSLRDPSNPGDYVAPGTYDAAQLGFSEAVDTITLYAEGVATSAVTSNERITVSSDLVLEDDAVRFRVYDLEHIAFDEETGTEYPAPAVSSPSRLTPELSIHLVEASLADTGQIVVELEGNVRDRLSELADDPTQRLQEVRLYVNGEIHTVIEDLPLLSPGTGVLPWQPYLLDVDFTETIMIDPGLGRARPGGYVIEARTSPNAAGHIAADRIDIAVAWRRLTQELPGVAAALPDLLEGEQGMTLEFAQAPSPAQSDIAWIYFGDRASLPTDGLVQETAPGSMLFSGVLIPGTNGVQVPLDLQFQGLVELDTRSIDELQASANYALADGSIRTIATTWIETDANSLRFIQQVPQGLSIVFAQTPSSGVADSATVYFGDRAPLPTDGQVQESIEEPDALAFTGEVIPPNSTDPFSLVVTLDTAAFGPGVVDAFSAAIVYTLAEDRTYTLHSTWTETAPDSLRFVQDEFAAPAAFQIGDDPSGGSYLIPVFSVREDGDFEPEGPQGWMDRTLLRVVGLDDGGGSLLRGLINGSDTPTQPFVFSPVRYYFVDENNQNRPRIFVMTVDDLPAGLDRIRPDNLFISNDVLRELEHGLLINGFQPADFIRTELFEDDFGLEAEPQADPPSNPVTISVLLTYFQLLYGEEGLELLAFLQNGGGAIQIGDVFGDLDIDYWFANAGTIDIEIEEDIDPVTAAAYLWAGLGKCLHLQPIVSQFDLGDLDLWEQAWRQRGDAAAEAYAAAVNLYVAGVSIVFEPLDWALTINELSQGHWEAAVGFIPFVPAAIGTGGRLVIKNLAGDVLETFDGPALDAIRQAATKKTFAARWQSLSNANLTYAQRIALVKSGFIRPNQSKGGLKNAVEQLGELLPPANFVKPEVHHMLPWRLRDEFAAWGFDVNNPQFAKWVEGAPHGHHQGWTRPYDEDWSGFLTNLAESGADLQTGQASILNRLVELDAQLVPGGQYPVP